MGDDPDPAQGFVFESVGSLIGRQCDPYVLQLIKKAEITVPGESHTDVVTETDGAKKKETEIKFKSKYYKF